MSFDRVLPSGDIPRWGFIGIGYAGSGTVQAQSGLIRATDQGAVLMAVRNPGNSADLNMVEYDRTNTRSVFGSQNLASMWLRVATGGAFGFRIGSVQGAALSGTTWEVAAPTWQWSSNTAAPLLTQSVSSGNTGENLGVRAQTGVITGGITYVQAGQGGTTGGEAQLRAASGTPRVRVDDTGCAFFNTAPIAKPTVTGSRGGNAALASLLTQLAALGLITDGTSA